MNEIVCYHEIDTFLENVRQFDVCDNPYESYAFLSIFLKYNREKTFYFFDVYEDGERIAIIPFECTFQSKVFNIKKFRFIGYREFNYEQFICQEELTDHVFRVFSDYLLKQPYRAIINYYDINDSSTLYNTLLRATFTKAVNKLYLCPCLHFSGDFESFFKEVYPSSKKRTELRKFQKRLSDLGEFRLLTIDNEASFKGNEQFIDQIYRVHADRFADVYATSFFGSERKRAYYSELIKNLIYYRKGYLSLLLMDDVVIAFVLCLTNGRVLIDWIPAFDPAFSKYSLGIVQYKMMFEQICTSNSNYEVFDYSKGSSVYKRKWAKQETANYQFIVKMAQKSFVVDFLYWIDTIKFSFKVYLRNKGVLGYIKRLLGKLLKKRTTNNKSVKTIHIEEELGIPFCYKDILKYPINVREVVMTSLYQGFRLASIQETDSCYVISLFKVTV